MSQEIVYTSAAAGLKTGSKGFCTVISTEGLTDYFSERLEMLSGYRHAFSPGDPKAPVNYSHLKIKVGRHDYHVLSRVCDAGFDYSQRSNKLAHHVALEGHELVPAGPAAVLAAPGFCITRWDGTTQLLSDGRLPPAHAVATNTCRTWETATGDAGWAGVLAETATSRRPKPVSIIFQAGTDTLSLVGESLALLSSQQRWNVSFSTYFTKAVAGSECLWQFVLDGTKQAEDLRARKVGKIIDLSSRLPHATGSTLVHLARSGKQASDPSQTMPPLPGGKAWPTRRPRVEEVAESAEDSHDEYDSHDPFQGIPELPASHRAKSQGLSRKQRGLLIGGIAIVAAAGAIVAGAFFAGRQRAQQAQFQLQPSGSSDPANASDASVNDNPSDATAESGNTSAIPAESVNRSRPDSSQNASAVASDENDGSLPLLELPATTGNISTTLGADYTGTCQLTLIGAAQFLNSTVALTKQSSVEKGQQEWRLTWKYPDSSTPEQLGSFTLTDGELSFSRESATAAREYEQFRNCLLKARSGSNQIVMAMRPPRRVEPQLIDFNSGKREPLRYQLPSGISRSMARSLRVSLELSDELPVAEVSDSQDGGASPPATADDKPKLSVTKTDLMRFPDGQFTNLLPDRRIGLAINQEGQMTSLQKIGRRRPGLSGRSPSGVAENIAEIEVLLSIEAGQRDQASGRATRMIAVKLTPEINIRRLKTVGRDFAHKFLTGDEELLAPTRSVPWSASAIEKEFARDRLLTEIAKPVIQQFNHKVPGKSISEVMDLTALDVVHAEIAAYYNEFALADENAASERLGQLIAAVKFKDRKREILTATTNQLQGRLLNLNAWLMIEGQRVPVLTTKAEQ